MENEIEFNYVINKIEDMGDGISRYTVNRKKPGNVEVVMFRSPTIKDLKTGDEVAINVNAQVFLRGPELTEKAN